MTASAYYVRNVPPELQARIARAAGARGLTVAQYLERLVALHDDYMTLYPAGGAARKALDRLGLEPVTT